VKRPSLVTLRAKSTLGRHAAGRVLSISPTGQTLHHDQQRDLNPLERLRLEAVVKVSATSLQQDCNACIRYLSIES